VKLPVWGRRSHGSAHWTWTWRGARRRRGAAGCRCWRLGTGSRETRWASHTNRVIYSNSILGQFITLLACYHDLLWYRYMIKLTWYHDTVVILTWYRCHESMVTVPRYHDCYNSMILLWYCYNDNMLTSVYHGNLIMISWQHNHRIGIMLHDITCCQTSIL
jgi:hypothetical protein